MILSEGWAMFGGIKNMPPRVGWSTFIRQIILSDDVNIIHRSKHFDWQEGWDWEPDVKWANIDVVSHKRNSSLKTNEAEQMIPIVKIENDRVDSFEGICATKHTSHIRHFGHVPFVERLVKEGCFF